MNLSKRVFLIIRVEIQNVGFIFKMDLIQETGASYKWCKNTGCSFQQAVTALNIKKDALLEPTGKNRPLS